MNFKLHFKRLFFTTVFSLFILFPFSINSAECLNPSCGGCTHNRCTKGSDKWHCYDHRACIAGGLDVPSALQSPGCGAYPGQRIECIEQRGCGSSKGHCTSRYTKIGACYCRVNTSCPPCPCVPSQGSSCGVCNDGVISCQGTCVGASTAPCAPIDIGLRVLSGTTTIAIAVEPLGTLTSPLRITKGGNIYGIKLVDRGDPKDSGFYIQTANDGEKALEIFAVL